MFKSDDLLGTEREKSYFKKYINALTKIKTISKQRYYEFRLEENKSGLYESMENCKYFTTNKP